MKPLQKPIDPNRNKRGGKCIRKMKKRYLITVFRKHANRMDFANIVNHDYQEDLEYSRGPIEKAKIRHIRVLQIDEKTKVRISKSLLKQQQ